MGGKTYFNWNLFLLEYKVILNAEVVFQNITLFLSIQESTNYFYNHLYYFKPEIFFCC